MLIWNLLFQDVSWTENIFVEISKHDSFVNNAC